MLLLLLLQVHEQEFGSESASGWVNGTFYMDPSLGRDTVMAVYFYSRDFNTHVGDIRLVSPDGVEHRGISETAMASLYVTPLEPIEKVIKIFLFFSPWTFIVHGLFYFTTTTTTTMSLFFQHFIFVFSVPSLEFGAIRSTGDRRVTNRIS
jgi:hypothetical protein